MTLRRSLSQALRGRLKRCAFLRPLRLANLEWRARRKLPDWRTLQSEAELDALEAAPKQGRVLIGTSVGLHLAVNTLDSLLAVALRLRGVDVDVLLCDGALPACQICEINWFPDPQRFVRDGAKDYCGTCYPKTARMYARLGIRVLRYSDLIDPEEERRAEALARETPYHLIRDVVVDGLPLGEHAMSGALRYFARGDLEGEKTAEPVLRRYLHAAALTAAIGRKLFADRRYAAVVAHHGIYVPQGTLTAVARQQGTRVVTWNPAYRRNCFIFSHDDTYHRTLLHEPSSSWEDIPWAAELDTLIDDYLESRATGVNDWISFGDASVARNERSPEALGLKSDKPIIVLLTNVVWDAQLHYPNSAFNGMIDWMLETVSYFKTRPDLQLVIRIHPAEVTGALPSRQSLWSVICSAFPQLPDNVIVIQPDDPVGTYAITAMCDTALIYGTKMGVELAAMGTPVIVAGEAWVRNKGLTQDVQTKEAYVRLLEALPSKARLGPDVVERARKFAFHYFFRRMIPLDVIEAVDGWPPYRVAVSSLDDLAAGASRGLDVICDGILKGSPFIYPAEEELQDASLPANKGRKSEGRLKSYA